MNKMIIMGALLLAACSGNVSDLASATRPDFTQGVLCGWYFKKSTTLAATPTPGKCWLVTPTPVMSVMPHGSSTCDADEGTKPRVWASGETIDLFTRTDSSGETNTAAKEVDCE